MTTNEEVLRRLHDAFARGEIEEAHATLHPEVEIQDHDIPDAAGGYRGHEGFDRWVEQNAEGYGDFAVEVEDVIDAGHDRLVALVKLRARGRASGIELERLDGVVYEFSGGLICRIDYYNDRAEALRAAGVEL